MGFSLSSGSGSGSSSSSSGSGVIDRLRALALRGAAPVAMTTPPTITLGLANANSTVKTANYDVGFRCDDLTVFTYAGGIPTFDATTGSPGPMWARGSQCIRGTTAAHRRGPLDVYFGSDAPDVDIAFNLPNSINQTYRVWVDEGAGFQPTALAPRTDMPTDFSGRRVKLAFGSSKQRRFRIELDEWINFVGVDVLTPLYSVWKTPIDSPRVLVAGDSYTAGVGASSALLGYAKQLQNLLGIPDIIPAGDGATGYGVFNNSVSPNTNKSLLARLGDTVTPYNPDLIIIPMGYNDASQARTATQIQADATAVYNGIFTVLPTTRVIVIGPWRTGSVPTTAQSNAVKAAAQADARYGSRLFYVDTIAENWQTGTGRVGATNSSGNSDIYITTDAIHPPDAGHTYLAQRVAEAVKRTLPLITA